MIVAFDCGHSLMDERRDREVPLAERPIHLMPGVDARGFEERPTLVRRLQRPDDVREKRSPHAGELASRSSCQGG